MEQIERAITQFGTNTGGGFVGGRPPYATQAMDDPFLQPCIGLIFHDARPERHASQQFTFKKRYSYGETAAITGIIPL